MFHVYSRQDQESASGHGISRRNEAFYRDEIKMFKILASTGAEERFLDPGPCYTDAVGDIDDAGELFEVCEKGDRYISVVC